MPSGKSLRSMRVIQGTGTLCEVYPVRRYGVIKRWPVRERIELPDLIRRTGHHMHHTTGFDREEIIDLCIRINSVQPEAGSPNWPPCLGLFKSVVATLTYMRHNRTQAEIGESLGVSQPTISRAISAITPLVPEATREFVPTADDLDPDAQYILDGTLLPCWSWDRNKELYSGKHKTTGMNVNVVTKAHASARAASQKDGVLSAVRYRLGHVDSMGDEPHGVTGHGRMARVTSQASADFVYGPSERGRATGVMPWDSWAER